MVALQVGIYENAHESIHLFPACLCNSPRPYREAKDFVKAVLIMVE